MHRYFLVLSLVLLHSIALFSHQFSVSSKETITIEECQEKDLQNCEFIFIEAFSKAYEHFTAEQLGVADKLLFLLEAFADVYDDFRQQKQKIIVAKKEGEVLGFIGFEYNDISHQVYISQLAVHPDYWKQGIGRELVFYSLQLYEQMEGLSVICRKINTTAIQFYEKLGFTKSTYMHSGYSPEKYCGFDWKKPK